jgi:trigger factor
VAENLGEFDTVDEWRASIAERISSGKLNRIRQQLVPKVTEALTGLTDIEAPTPMVESDLQSRVQNTVRQFSAQGIDLEGWLAATGQDTNSFVEGLRVQSQQAVKADLALRAVAVAEAIEIADADVEAEYARIAMEVGQKAKDVRKAYERNDAVPELVAQMRKSKALDWLLHHVEIVDPDGKPIDRELVLGHTHDDDTHDDEEHGGEGVHDHTHADDHTDDDQDPRPEDPQPDDPDTEGARA